MAKINLYLAVRGRRPDGYHEIASLMQKVELSDRLQIRRGENGIRLQCPGSGLPVDERNLAYKAALIFFDATGIAGRGESTGIDIMLQKNIPVAAGLGGGSSDAAAVLKGLDKLFDTRLQIDQLLAMAGSLGADVPFFIPDHSAAWATGIGEQLAETAPLNDCHILLVNPGFPVSTRWVYENFALTSKGNPYILAPNRKPPAATDRHGQTGQGFHLPVRLFNDLEKVTVKRFPEIGLIKQELRSDGAAGVLMSGSGSTVFALFEKKDRAALSFEKFAMKYGNNVFLTRPCRP